MLNERSGLLKDQSLKLELLKQRKTQLENEFEAEKGLLLQSFNTIKQNPIKIVENRREIRNATMEKNKTESCLNHVTKISQQYSAQMEIYREFEKNTDENNPILLEKYQSEWEKAEKDWYNWSIDRITGWFEYILTKNGSITNTQTDFDLVKTNLEKDKYRGKYLLSMDTFDLKKYGIENNNGCHLLYKSVCKLIEKYPQPKNEEKCLVDIDAAKNNAPCNVVVDGINNGDACVVPNEFLCPISQTIMKNPVIAFDGITYEKENIIKYLNDNVNGTMPNSNEKICNVEMAIADLAEDRMVKEKMAKETCTAISNDNGEIQDIDIESYLQGVSLRYIVLQLCVAIVF